MLIEAEMDFLRVHRRVRSHRGGAGHRIQRERVGWCASQPRGTRGARGVDGIDAIEKAKNHHLI